MLTIESLKVSADLTAVLADKGAVLKLEGNSPLIETMRCTRQYGDAINDLADLDGVCLNVFQANSPRFCDGESEENLHSAFQDAASKELGAQLAVQVSYATSVVLPLVTELHTDLVKCMDIEASIRAGAGLEIVPSSMTPLLDVPEMVSELEKFAGVTIISDPYLVLDFKPVSDEELLNLMKIGSESYDKAVDLFVAQEGIVNVRETYQVVFEGERNGFKNYNDFRACSQHGNGRNIATFLIATKLLMDFDSGPGVTGVSGLDLARYKVTLRVLQEVSGKALYVGIDLARSNEKTGRLIDRIDGKKVYVNGNVYERYLADGGDIETVLGCAISGDRTFYVAQLKENSGKYQTAWGYHVALTRSNCASQHLVDVRRLISDFIRGITTRTDDEVVHGNIRTIITNVDMFVEKLFLPELKDLPSLALNAICNTAFNHCDAKVILGSVTQAMCDNPDITREDAMNLAVTQYVAHWFASQISIA